MEDIEKIHKEIKEIVADVLEEDPDNIMPEAKFVEDLGVDSLMSLEILTAIEKKYKIEIPDEYLPKFTTLNQVVTLIQEFLTKENK